MAGGKSILHRPTELTYEQRVSIYDKTVAKVTKYYFDPNYNGTNWPARAREKREQILAKGDPEMFESAIHDLVRSLGTSHTGFFHQSVRRVPARLAIGANFSKVNAHGRALWVAHDVHEGGPAASAGLKPLDVLTEINGTAIAPPEQPTFPMGTLVLLTIQRDSQTLAFEVNIPVPRSRKQPFAQPKPVTFSTMDCAMGYLKVSVLPGLLGLDVAREIDAAVAALSSCDRLILDLRGHLGGGLGVLRLMSYLTSKKLPIGYTVTRRTAEKGYVRDNLRKLERLPTDKPNAIAILFMAMKYGVHDPSLLLVSEGLGRQKWHEHVAILVNEHTISAGEMVSAFAKENSLATIVGTETAGRLTPGSGFNVGHGYMLVIPKAAYITWGGNRFEGHGVLPDTVVSWSPESLAVGRDNQLEAGMDVLRDF